MFVYIPLHLNASINEIFSLETKKAGLGWTEEEMWHHYMFNLHTKHALGLEQLGEVHFELRSVNNFRQRLGAHTQETGINILEQVFEKITD